MIVLTTTCNYSSAITLACQFQTIEFSAVGNIYSCIENSLFNESGKVTYVSGTHISGKANQDVRGLRLYKRSMNQFPVNIEAFFPKIIALNFGENSITHINNSHLIPFPQLQYLSLWKNRLTSLDGNLFSGLDSIKYINFEFNKIKHVGHDLVLPNSGEINFYGNVCINILASNPDEIAWLRFLLTVYCPPTILHIENSLESRTNLLTHVNLKVHILEQNNSQIEQRLRLLAQRVASLETIIEDMGLEIEQLDSGKSKNS